MPRNDNFDWLDDPFDEKKVAQEQARAATSGSTKIGLGCGCMFLAVVAAVVFMLVSASFIGSIAYQ